MLIKLQKLLLVLVICVSLIFSYSSNVFAEIDEDVRLSLNALGLMEGYPDGSFGEENRLTRAEMTMITSRVMSVGDHMYSRPSPFTDVSEEHWAKSVIVAMHDMKVINGVGDNKFEPDEYLDFYAAVKILVSSLGYGDYAMEEGGYPDGYIKYATKLGILKNIPSDEYITRETIANMLYNSLSVKPTGYVYAENYSELNYTLYEILSKKESLTEITGILTLTENMSIESENHYPEKGIIHIDGNPVKCDVPMDEHIGREITVYTSNDGAGYPKLVSFVVTGQNTEFSTDADLAEFSGNQVILYDETGKELKKLTLADGNLVTVYNGRVATLMPSERIINYGNYTFLNNDYDKDIDILFINEAQSFIVDKVNTLNNTVYFTRGQSFNGRSAVLLESEDDKLVYVSDSSGNTTDISKIESGNVITIFASAGNKYVEAYVSSDAISGEISEIAGNSVVIDGKSYKYSKKPDGTSYFVPELSKTQVFALDMFGNIVDATSDVVDRYKYAYVIEAGKSSGLSSSVFLKTVDGASPQKEVKVSGNTETISYYFRNNIVETYELADDVKLNGYKVNISEIIPSSLNKNLVAYKLNADGKIREIYTEDISRFTYRDHVFNAELMSFGGENVSRGYLADKNTMFICVPENGSTGSEDYYVQVKVTDKSVSNKVCGTVFFPDIDYEDPDAEPVDILVISANMDAASTPTIQRDGDICIVGATSQVTGEIFDDEGQAVIKLELLKGNEVITEVVKSGTLASNIASKLRKGDLVRYTKDGFGRIVNIQKLVSSQGLGTNYTNDLYIGAGSESAIFGKAYHSILNIYDYYTNQMVDKLQLTYSTDGSGSILSAEYRLPVETPPDIYSYNRTTGVITPGAIEDIVTYTQVGNSADDILAVIESNDIKALVIIVD